MKIFSFMAIGLMVVTSTSLSAQESTDTRGHTMWAKPRNTVQLDIIWNGRTSFVALFPRLTYERVIPLSNRIGVGINGGIGSINLSSIHPSIGGSLLIGNAYHNFEVGYSYWQTIQPDDFGSGSFLNLNYRYTGSSGFCFKIGPSIFLAPDDGANRQVFGSIGLGYAF